MTSPIYKVHTVNGSRKEGHTPPPTPHGNCIFFFHGGLKPSSAVPLFFFPLSPFPGIRQPGKNLSYLVCCFVIEPDTMKYILVSGGKRFSFLSFVFSVPSMFSNLDLTLTAGVISGVGKGIIASSCGLLLKTLGLTVSSIKVDPYLNIDAGLMSYVFLCSMGFYACAIADLPILLDQSSMFHITTTENR